MSGPQRTLIFLGLLCCCLFASLPAAAAGTQGAASIKAVHRDTQKARAIYLDAVRVEERTSLYSRRYRPDVGRWVRLARRAGWSWSSFDWLMRQIEQESKGDPRCNHDGLLQITAPWHDGSDASAAALFKKHHLSYPWDATNPWQTFLHAKVMDRSNWWIVGQ